MKKMLKIIIILLLIILFVVTRPKGDVNFDGKVDLIDLIQLRQILVNEGGK